VNRLVRSLGFVVLLASGCGDADPDPALLAKQDLAAGRWAAALERCTAPASEAAAPATDACDASYCALIAQAMQFVDELNDFLLPNFRTAELGVPPGTLDRYVAILQLMDRIAANADDVIADGCRFDLPTMPFRLGDAPDPIVQAEIRGRWTTRSAALLQSIVDSVRYIFLSQVGAAPVPPPDETGVPGLPDLLERVRSGIALHDLLLDTLPADPALPQSGWLDRNRDGAIDAGDELLLDFFEPGTQRRIFDFRGAELVRGEALPLGIATRTEDLPPARCGYRSWHVDTLFEGPEVGTTDGMSFSPDGGTLALPIKEGRDYQIQLVELATGERRCLTCGAPPGWNDGVRWQPRGDVLVFVSARDHPYPIGGAGGGAGQELYAMRTDGSQVTRLTQSSAWATNYHVNWSHDGRRIVWGSTEARTWDVMVADFVDDEHGLRLANVRRLTHDTSWWETHGFTADGRSVLTTNTRAGWQSADLYLVDVASGARTRLTDDLSWDEHGHFSPDGRKISWISARWRPAGMLRMTNGSLSPALDFFWIAPAILFEFYNYPAGFSTELTLMDADGGALQRLTFDDQVVADNEWSPDGKRIVFRQTPTHPIGPARIQILTFDDCEP
jgi:Tol biopolymer transport system component